MSDIFDEEKPENKELKDARRVADRISEGLSGSYIPDTFGICSQCSNFIYLRTKYDKEFTDCSWLNNIKPTSVDPIMVCVHFSNRNQLGIKDMWNLATFIEVGDKKIGFDL
jgi:hypothetical protein